MLNWGELIEQIRLIEDVPLQELNSAQLLIVEEAIQRYAGYLRFSTTGPRFVSLAEIPRARQHGAEESGDGA